MGTQFLTILAQIGALSAMAIIIVAFINRRTSKLIQAAISNQSDKIELLKNDLTIKATKQGKLYEKTMEIIDELHTKLVTLQINTSIYLTKVRNATEKGEFVEDEVYQTERDLILDLDSFISFKKHFLNDNLISLVVRIKTEYLIAAHTYFVYHVIDTKDKQVGLDISEEEKIQNVDDLNKIAIKLRIELPSAIEKLENEFRKLLGVAD